MRASAAYRMQAAQNLLHRFWLRRKPARERASQRAEARSAGRTADDAMNRSADARASAAACTPRCAHDIGRAARRRRGASTSTTCREPPGTLHAALGHERAGACAHRVARRLDAVRTAPGVVAVLTAADIPGVNDCSPSSTTIPIFADGLVQYVGQPLFAVAADTHGAGARRAARLAVVEYEDLPALLDGRAGAWRRSPS